MKRNKIVSAILIVFSIAVVSCKENVALEYENDPALYFVRNQYGQRDSIDHSFMMVPGNGPDTLYIEVMTQGFLSDIDRPVLIEQANVGGSDAAVAGKHYVPFTDPEMVKLQFVPAGKVRASIPVILLRDESLDTTKVRLLLEVKQNEYFRPGISTMTDFLIKTTAEMVKPSAWDVYYRDYLGEWGPVKMKFVMDYTGETEFKADAVIDWKKHIASMAKEKLKEYNNNPNNPDTPLKEKNGTIVTFP